VEDTDPSTASEDISVHLSAHQVPQTVNLQYWISTAGIGLVGSFSMNFRWVDKMGVMRVMPGDAISLLNLNSLFGFPANAMLRQNDESPVFVDTVLTGLALGAKVSYFLLISSGSGEGNIAI